MPISIGSGSAGLGPASVNYNLQPQLTFAGVLYYVPITLTNTQGTAVTGGTQILITVNWSTYGSFLDSNIDNVGFFDSGFSNLNAWVETGASSISTSSSVWVKLNSAGIAGNGSVTIYLGFYSLNTNNFSSSGYWGEAPSLSGTFGQYDNGAQVFSMYVNFQGGSQPSGWTLQGQGSFVGGTSATGGIRLLTGSGNSEGAVSYNTALTLIPQTFEVSGMYSGTADDFGVGFYSSGPTGSSGGYNPAASSGYYAAYEFWSSGRPTLMVNAGTAAAAGSQTMATSGQNYLFAQTIAQSSMITMAHTSTTSAQYVAGVYSGLTSDVSYSTTTSTAQTTFYVGGSTGSYAATAYVYWARARTYPPSNTMPNASFGSLTSTTPGTVVITSAPQGTGFVTVDGTPITTSQVFSWTVGDNHTISANTVVTCGTGCQYVYTSWSDGGSATHTITVSSSVSVYTANFQQQYQLSMAVSPTGTGTTSPAIGTGWQNAYSTVTIIAYGNSTYIFSSWTGSGTGSYTGNSQTSSVTMSGAITETATFVTGYDIINDQFSGGFNGWAYTTPWPNGGATACSTSQYSLTYDSGNGQPAPSLLISGAASYPGCYAVMQKTVSLSTPIPTYASQILLTFSYHITASSVQQNGPYSANLYVWIYDGTNNLWSPPIIYNSGVTDSGWVNYGPTNIASYVNGHPSFTIYIGLYANFYSILQKDWIDNVHLYYITPVVPITITSSPTTGYWLVAVDGLMVPTPYVVQWTPGTTHTIAAYSITPGVAGTGVQYAYSSWSDGGGPSHPIVVPSSATTYTAIFTSQSIADFSYDQFSSDLNGWTYTSAWPNPGATACSSSYFSLLYDQSNGQPPPASAGTPAAPSALVSGYQQYQGCYAMMQKTFNIGATFPSTMYLTFNYVSSTTYLQNQNPWSNNLYLYIYDGQTQLYGAQVYNQQLYDSKQYGNIGQIFGPFNIASYVAGHPVFTVYIGFYSNYYTGIQQDWDWIDNVHMYYPSYNVVPITITSSPAAGYWFVTVDGFMEPTPYTVQWTVGSPHTIAAYSPVPGVSGSNIQYAWSSWSDAQALSHIVNTPGSATTYTATFTSQATADFAYDQFGSDLNGWTYTSAWPNPGATACSSGSYSLSYDPAVGQPPPASAGTPAAPSALVSGFAQYQGCYAMMQKTFNIGATFPSTIYVSFNYLSSNTYLQNQNPWSNNVYLYIYDGQTQLYGAQVYNQQLYDSKQYGSTLGQLYAPFNIASYVTGHPTFTVYIGFYSNYYTGTQKAWIDNVHLYYTTYNTVPITVTSSPAAGYWFVTVDGFMEPTPYTVQWTVGSTHTIAAYSPVPGTSGSDIQYAWSSWSDGLGQSHPIVVLSSATTYTANFQSQPIIDVVYDQFGSDLSGWTFTTAWLDPGSSACSTTYYSLIYDQATGQPPPASQGSPASPSALMTGFQQYQGCYAMMQKTVTLGQNFPSAIYLTFNYRSTNTYLQNQNPWSNNVYFGIYDGSHNLYWAQVYSQQLYDSGNQIYGPFNIASYVNGHTTFTIVLGFYSNYYTGTQKVWFDNVQLYYPTSNTVSTTITSSPATGYWFASVDGITVQTPYTVLWTASSPHTIGAYTYTPGTQGSGVQYIWSSWSDGLGQSHQIYVPSSATTYTATFTAQSTVDLNYDQFPTDTSGWTYGAFSGTTTCSSSYYLLTVDSSTGQIPPASSGTPAAPSARVSGSQQYPNCMAMMNKQISLAGWAYPAPLYISFDYLSSNTYLQNQNPWSNNVYVAIYDGSTQLMTNTQLYNSNSWTSAQYGSMGLQYGPINIASYASGHTQLTVYVGFYANYYTGSQNAWFDNVHLYYPGTSSAIIVTSAPLIGAGYVLVDGSPVSTPQTVSWAIGSTHNITAFSTMTPGGSCSTGCQYAFSSWSDGGALSHMITVQAGPVTYIAYFQHQYQLTTSASPSNGGTIAPAVGNWWYNSGAQVRLNETASTGYSFNSWTGSGTGSYSGSAQSYTITMNGPITETANFGNTISITVASSPVAGSGYVSVDGSSITSPQTYPWVIGSLHNLTSSSLVSCGAGCNYAFMSWSDSGAQSHSILVPNTVTTFTATFQKQYSLTMIVSPSGTGTTTPLPGLSWYNQGMLVPISASSNSSYAFEQWTGSGSGAYTGLLYSTNVTMNGPIVETATFSSGITVTSNPSGGGYIIADNASITTPHPFFWTPTSVHVLQAQTPVSCGNDCQYAFVSWYSASLGTQTSASIIYTVPSRVETVIATYKLQYLLTVQVNPSGGGFVTLTPTTGGWYDGGTVVSANATANTGYTFGNWTLDTVFKGAVNPIAVSVNAPHVLMANFATRPINRVTITFFQDPSSSGGTVTVNGVEYQTGQSGAFSAGTYTITANQPSGFTFNSWQYSGSITVTGGQSGATLDVSGTTSGAVTVIWSWINPPITFLESGLGADAQGTVITVSTTPPTLLTLSTPLPYAFTTWTAGTQYAVSTPSTMISSTGNRYAFAGWTCRDYNGGDACYGLTVATDNSGLSYGTGTYTVPAVPANVTANYVLEYLLNVAVNDPSKGMTDPAPGPYWVPEGNGKTVYASPNSVVTFSNWLLDGVNIGGTNPYTVQMTSQHNITAIFTTTVNTSVQVTVTSGPPGSGYVSVDRLQIATPQTYTWTQGTTHNLTAVHSSAGTPGSQYVFQSWSDGAPISHTITVPATAVNYTARYQQQYQLTMLTPSGSGTTSPAAGTRWYNAFETVRATATPSPGSTFSYWSRDGQNSTSTSATYTFTMGAPHTLQAVFSQKTLFTLTVVTNPPSLVPEPTRTPGDQFPLGTQIEVTAQPVTSWTLQGFTVIEADDGAAVDFTVSNGNQATFNMPQHDVTVTANYKFAGSAPGASSGLSIPTFNPAAATLASIALLAAGLALERRRRTHKTESAVSSTEIK